MKNFIKGAYWLIISLWIAFNLQGIANNTAALRGAVTMRVVN